MVKAISLQELKSIYLGKEWVNEVNRQIEYANESLIQDTFDPDWHQNHDDGFEIFYRQDIILPGVVCAFREAGWVVECDGWVLSLRPNDKDKESWNKY